MSNGKPTAVHFSLIFFVMLSIILAVLFWITKSDYNESQTQLAAETESNAAAKEGQRQSLNELNEIKRRAGLTDLPVGLDDDETEQTMLGAMKKLMAEIGSGPMQGDQSWVSAIRKLHSKYENARGSLQKRQDEINRKEAELEALNEAKKATNTKFQEQTAKAEEDLRKTVQSKDEELTAMSQQVDELKQEKEDLLTQVAQLQQTLKDATDEFEERLAGLTARNNKLRQEQDELIDQTWERADGLVQFVDHGRKLAFINLGSSDGLPVRTSFSVYRADHQGVARRNKEDIKAKIEVTRIVGSHLAEARILEQDIALPIAKGDPVYSPLFTVGVKEKISFVGTIDLDGDGNSDRERLHTIVAAAGAEVDNEVLDDGSLVGDGLSVDTSFLVIGDIPSAEPTADPDQDEANAQVRAMEAELKQSARELGIRWVALKDFMDYVGYKPRSRLFRPGEEYELGADE